jgi:hypothetical protein
MDRSTKDFTINAQLLGALGSLWQGTPTIVSPFRYGKTSPIGNEERAALLASGVVDASGQPVPDIRPALDILGNADAFTRMYITGALNAYEYIAYFTADGRTASLINIKGDVQINCPSIADLFVSMASQALGSSIYRNATVEASLTPDEALVFFAMIDLQRRAFLQSLAQSQECTPISLESSSVEAVLSDPNKSNQWLNNVVSELVAEKNAPAPQVPTALVSLADKGLVLTTGSTYRLSDDAAVLARRMLVIDTNVILTSGKMTPDGIVSIAGFTCLQAGVHDLLYFDTSAGTVDIQAVSSAAVLEFIRIFMTDPEALKKLIGPAAQKKSDAAGTEAPATPAAASHRHCTQCGAEVVDGRKFCGKCGAKVS